MDIDNFKVAVHSTAVDHGWWPEDGRNFGELIALMHSELSEALEAYRDGDDVTKVGYLNGKPVGVASELADCIIRILDASEYLDIPITEALIKKHKYNMTRPWRHGGKLA